ncbi:MAG TPA: ABC transporter ATP-binding protein [Opitutaceae bacterium]
MAGTPLLTLLDVEKRFESGTVALSGLSLSVEAGSFVSLLGPSGCGKSTVLRLVAGLSKPSRGTIEWSNPTGTAVRAKPRLSYVFQEPTLMPWASVLANVMLPFRFSGVPEGEAREKARESLRTVGLEGFEDAYPRELSGGMKMRASLARALITQPEMMLLDEPFAALDEITRLKLTSDLAELWRTRRFTALFVTHSVFESVFLSQRVIVMAARPGRVFVNLPVDAPLERGGAFRTSQAYAESCRGASEALIGAMGK